jgi:hypothetical protein
MTCLPGDQGARHADVKTLPAAATWPRTAAFTQRPRRASAASRSARSGRRIDSADTAKSVLRRCARACAVVQPEDITAPLPLNAPGVRVFTIDQLDVTSFPFADNATIDALKYRNKVRVAAIRLSPIAFEASLRNGMPTSRQMSQELVI